VAVAVAETFLQEQMKLVKTEVLAVVVVQLPLMVLELEPQVRGTMELQEILVFRFKVVVAVGQELLAHLQVEEMGLSPL
jgi:hypothetical protein